MKSGEVLALRYRLDARLGFGGMGEVWRATHTGTGRAFAVKIMHAHAATAESARQRFAHEAQASAKIKHPAIVDVFDVGELEDGALYLAMELLDGVLLADALHAKPPLSARDFLVIMLGVAHALAAAHAVGIIHRDVKPANVFLHKSRETGFYSPKVLDFGVSKFTSATDSHATKVGSVLGSPRYMSPEQARSAANVDVRADLWAVGVLLFEGLTGAWPHEGDSFSSLVVAICTQPPASIDAVAPGLPAALRALVRDCLAPLDQRLADASTLAARIEAALVDPSLAALPLPTPRNPPDRETRSVSGVHVRAPSPAGAIEPPSRSSFQLPRPFGENVPAPRERKRMPTMTELVDPAMLAARPPSPSLVMESNPSTSPGFLAVPRTMKMEDTGDLGAAYRASLVGGAGAAPPGAAPRAITFGTPPPLPAIVAQAPPPSAQTYPTGPRPASRTSRPLLIAAVVLGVFLVAIVIALVLTLRAPR